MRASIRQSPTVSTIGEQPIGAWGTSIHGFILAHILLALLVRQFPQLSTVHVYFTLGVGVIWALSRPPIYTAYVAAYIVGTEAFWRMTNASFFWEGGKYAIVLIMLLSLIHHRQKRIPALPLFYFLLLLPSTILSLENANARELISFNLSGPLALFVSAWFFSVQRLSFRQLHGLLLAMVAPILTTAVYAILITLNLDQIRWVNDSMFQTSGGFGPNQVSTIMGLGVLATWLLLLMGRFTLYQRWFLILTSIFILVQGLLTFSRGGIVAAVITVVVFGLHTVTDQKRRVRIIFIVATVAALLTIVVIPALDEFTQGFFGQRFTDTNLTHRDLLAQTELNLFLENPLFGVGPGMGGAARGATSHTELTRLLSEHGITGLISLGLLVLMAIRGYLQSKSLLLRGMRGVLLLWTLIVMTNAAMRLAAISFVFGLGFATIDLDETN
jgi:O-antigen ligase